MQLHQLSDTVQELCHEGHSLARVSFSVDNVPYVLKSVEVTPIQVIFRLQAEPQHVVHTGFLGVGEKSSKSLEKT